MAGPSFYQRHVPKFNPSGSGRRYVAGTPVTNPRGGGVRRLRFPGMSYTSIRNRYVAGSGVGSTNAAARRALRRRASTGQNGRPCGFDCPPTSAPALQTRQSVPANSTITSGSSWFIGGLNTLLLCKCQTSKRTEFNVQEGTKINKGCQKQASATRVLSKTVALETCSRTNDFNIWQINTLQTYIRMILRSAEQKR